MATTITGTTIDVGTNVIVTDAAGNVGIGTSSPNRNLHVSGGAGDVAFGITNAATGTAASDGFSITVENPTPDVAIRQRENNDMKFLTNNAEAMRINSAGIITKPLQPAYSATASSTNIPLNTETTITLTNERFDVGGNLASNVFTAPVTGKYMITYLLYLNNVDSAHTTLDVHIKTSLKQYQQTWKMDSILQSDANFSVSGSQLCDMDSGDTQYFAIYIAGGHTGTDVHADSQVSGYLVC